MKKLKEVLVDGLEFVNSSPNGRGEVVTSEKLKEGVYKRFFGGSGKIDENGFLWVEMFGTMVATFYRVRN